MCVASWIRPLGQPHCSRADPLGSDRRESVCQPGSSQGVIEKTAWSILYALIPNFQMFWMLDALDQEKHIQPIYLLYAAGYTGAWLTAMALLAFALFLERQVGAASKI